MKYQVIYDDDCYGDFFEVEGNSKCELAKNIKDKMNKLNLTKLKIIEVRKIK